MATESQIASLLDQIGSDAAQALAEATSPTSLDDVSTFDFARYEFVIEPFTQAQPPPEQLTDEAISYLDDLEASGASAEVLEYIGDLLVRLEATVRTAFSEGASIRRPSGSRAIVLGNLPTLGGDIPRQILRPLYTLHRRLVRKIVDLDREIPNFFDEQLFPTIRAKARGIWFRVTHPLVLEGDVPQSSEPLFDWVYFVETINWWMITDDLEIDQVDLAADVEYPFLAYDLHTVNVGIAVIYRQRWTALGTQPGEIVRTIPLGPGQSEKLVTKVMRRRKSTSTTETTTEMETSTRTTDTSKDSTEVVKEAASNQNWSVSAQASYGIGGFGASASGQMGGSSSSSSKNTSSNLSEMMQETASKLRRQTKVTISTETEISAEESLTSEVRNANDEVALTLQYHTLQTLYDVYTRLFGVHRAIFVPEELPLPYMVDADWVRRHDWIIAAELLDESFRDTLNHLIQDEDTESLIEYGGPDDPYSSMLRKASDKFASFDTPGNAAGLGGLDVDDIYSRPQTQFDQYRRDEESRRRANRIRAVRRHRLFRHIRDNILHYCRAIWAREDAEQRLLRYRREGRGVPYVWSAPIDATGVTSFEPTDHRVPIDEVIDDIVPIGFTGNYVVFKLAVSPPADGSSADIDFSVPDGEITLLLGEFLDLLRASYTDPSGTELRDPALDLFLDAAQSLPAGALASLSDDTVADLVSYVPELEISLIGPNGTIRNADGTLTNPVSAEMWALYQLRKNGTRRFLVDSDNLYVSLLLGDGIALEPFKRAHRLIDVLKALELREAEALKNERRGLLKADPGTFDPDIAKVVIAPGQSAADVVAGVLDDGTANTGGGSGGGGSGGGG